MPISLSPKYYQAGSTGKYELYKPIAEEDKKLPFRFDTVDVEAFEEEMAELERELGITPDME